MPEPRVTQDMLQSVREQAMRHHEKIKQGHGPDHILRVEKLALKFLPEDGNQWFTSLIALLHDAGDYKLVSGKRPDIPNAVQIMDCAGIPSDIRDAVMLEIDQIGYSNRLSGKMPYTDAGKAVSDADMCDIMGATGILRLAEYDAARGISFFDPDDIPEGAVTAESYKKSCDITAVRHMFDKILRLPELMLTVKGRAEAEIRRLTDVMFIRALFREQDAKQWDDILRKFIAETIDPRIC